MSKKSLKISLVWCVFIALMPCVAKADDASASKLPHYKLVMSENDVVCKPLANLYNEMLADAMKQSKKTGQGVITNFEMQHPEEFAKVGFNEPPKKEIELPSPPGSIAKTYKEPLYLFDLFGEGKPRTIVYYSTWRGGGAVQLTGIKILKKDAIYENVKTGGFSVGVAPNIIDQDASYNGLLASQKSIYPTYPGYLLTKWPNFDKIYQNYLAQQKTYVDKGGKLQYLPHLPPSINEGGTPTSAKLFIYDNHPYFILNGYVYDPGKQESNILIYTIGPSSHTDICYLNLPLQPIKSSGAR